MLKKESFILHPPLFYSFLMTSAVNKRTKECSWFSSIAIVGSVLLKQRSEKMDATGVLLKSKSVEASYCSMKNVFAKL